MNTINKLKTNEETTFTKQEISDAYMFLNSIKLDLTLRSRWKTLLDSAKEDKAAPEEKIQYLDKFLTENGFNVGAEVVLYMLQTPWWKSYLNNGKANQSSDQFVQRVLQDSKLFSNWNKIVSDTPLKANQVLKDLGYDCNLQQVASSFIEMRRQNLAFWTGIYGKVSITDVNGKKVDKDLTLIIYKDHVSLGSDTIFGWTYKNGQLTWPLTSYKASFPNNCSGAITFSEIIHPKEEGGYTGHIFSGILDYSDSFKDTDKTYNYGGQVGDPVGAIPYEFRQGSPKSQISSKISFIVGMALAGLITVSIIVPIIVKFVRWRQAKAKDAAAALAKDGKDGKGGKGGKGGGENINELEGLDIEMQDALNKTIDDIKAIQATELLEKRLGRLKMDTRSFDKAVKKGKKPLAELQTKTDEQISLEKIEKSLKDTPSSEIKEVEKLIDELKAKEETAREQAIEDEVIENENMNDAYDELSNNLPSELKL